MDDALVEKVARAINPTPWSLKDYGLPMDEFATAELAMTIHRARAVLALPDLHLAGVKEGLEMAAKHLEEEAMNYRHAQSNAKSNADRLYRMGQKDACHMEAVAIRSLGPRP